MRRPHRKGRRGRNTRSTVLRSCPAAGVEVNLRLQPPVFTQALGERSRAGSFGPHYLSPPSPGSPDYGQRAGEAFGDDRS